MAGLPVLQVPLTPPVRTAFGADPSYRLCRNQDLQEECFSKAETCLVKDNYHMKMLTAFVFFFSRDYIVNSRNSFLVGEECKKHYLNIFAVCFQLSQLYVFKPHNELFTV